MNLNNSPRNSYEMLAEIQDFNRFFPFIRAKTTN